MGTYYSIPNLDEGKQITIFARQSDHPVKYVVDASGRGTHKTVADALNDAAKNPHRTTFVTIRPIITLENFDAR